MAKGTHVVWWAGERRGDEVSVSAINAREMFTLIDRPELTRIAADADERLQRVMEKL